MEKLLVMVSLGQRAYGRRLFQRLLSHIIVVIGLIFIISMMVSALLIGSLFAANAALQQVGIAPDTALAVTAGSAVLIIILLVLLALKHLRQVPRLLSKQSPLTSSIADTFDAFLDGFMEK